MDAGQGIHLDAAGGLDADGPGRGAHLGSWHDVIGREAFAAIFVLAIDGAPAILKWILRRRVASIRGGFHFGCWPRNRAIESAQW